MKNNHIHIAVVNNSKIVEAAALLSGDSSALVLGSDNVVGVGALVAPVGMVSPVWMELLGLLVAGGLWLH